MMIWNNRYNNNSDYHNWDIYMILINNNIITILSNYDIFM